MKKSLFIVMLCLLFCGIARSQDNSFKGKRYTFDLLDQKNPSFSEAKLISDLSSLNGVMRCKFMKEQKKVVIYATELVTLPMVRVHLKNQNLGILNFTEENIKVTNLDAAVNETK